VPTATLNELQKDALKEIGNIGAGHAATALSQLLNTKIGLVEPRIDVITFGELTTRVRHAERPVAALRMEVRGQAPGEIVVLFDREQATGFVGRFIRRVIGDITIFESIAESTLKELGNIVAGSYLSAIVHLTGVRLEPSVPSLSYGTVDGALADLMSIHPDRPVFLVESVFLDNGVTIAGEFVFIPEYGSLAPLLSIFGI
jgi:chemotaxis protein CheC